MAHIDDQNLIEKLGIVRDLGEIKVSLARIEASQTGTTSQLKEHHEIIFGNGAMDGLNTVVDRLDQIEKGRQTRWALTWTAIGGLIVERAIAVLTWVRHAPP